MKSVIQPRLVNGPFGDPALYVRLQGERSALLFDLGDIGGLSPSEIMRISDVFVSHTHIDHFIGFDHLLRIVLGRDKRIRFFGPPGLVRQVRGRLSGYTWNLVDDYRLELEVAEFSGRVLRRRLFTCRDRFREERDLGKSPAPEGLLLDTPLYAVRAAVLDHRTPCLAFVLEEKARVGVDKEKLRALGLAVGPWLTAMKRVFLSGREEERIRAARAAGGFLEMTAGELVRGTAAVTRGRKIAYVTDITYTPSNERKVVTLARGADVFYGEAAFMERDLKRAWDRCHLTAGQVGAIAGRAGAGRLEVFHFSPRYQHEEEAVRKEAEEAFRREAPGRPGGARRAAGGGPGRGKGKTCPA